MNITRLLKLSEKFVTDNSPVILTGVGVVGTVATAVLTGKASFKAAKILHDAKFAKNINRLSTEPHDALTKREAFEKVWLLYMPAVGVCTLTCASIIFANRISTRRAMALAAMYTVSEKAHEEYKQKVAELFGKQKEQKVGDEVVQDQVDANPLGGTQVIVTPGGDVLCYDSYTGRYFNSSMEDIKSAENKVNNMILNNGYASMNDFYQWLGLEHTEVGEEFGWSTESGKLMEINYSTVMADNQKPCIAISFKTTPIRNYFRVH